MQSLELVLQEPKGGPCMNEQIRGEEHRYRRPALKPHPESHTTPLAMASGAQERSPSERTATASTRDSDVGTGVDIDKANNTNSISTDNNNTNNNNNISGKENGVMLLLRATCSYLKQLDRKGVLNCA